MTKLLKEEELRKIIKNLLNKDIFYHITNKNNIERILKEGLLINQKPQFSQASSSWMKEAYNGIIPIFLTKDPENYLIDNEKFVSLKVNCRNLNLCVDIPSLIDFGAYIDEDCLYWEKDNPISHFDEEIFFEDLIEPFGDYFEKCLNLTKTAACLTNITPDRISL